MKVLHVIDSLGVGGGAEHSLVAMLPLLKDLGIDSEVVVLTPREKGLFQTVQDLGLPLTTVGGTSRLDQARHLRRLIREQKPDLVHATLPTSSLVTRMAAFGTGVPQLHSLVSTTYDRIRKRDSSSPAWKLRVLRVVDRATSHTVRGHFHAISKTVQEHAVHHLGIARSRITVIPRGRSRQDLGWPSPSRRARARASLGCTDAELIILTVGRQDFPKAQDVLVTAFDRAAQLNDSLRLVMAGRRGSASPSVEAAVSGAATRDRIQVLGHRTDVADLLCAADVFVFPSYYEGFGGAVIEAMAMGCPIIGSDAGALRELLQEGVGVVVPRGDPDELATAILELSASPETRRELSARAMSVFQERYTLEAVAEETVALYHAVLQADGLSTAEESRRHRGTNGMSDATGS